MKLRLPVTLHILSLGLAQCTSNAPQDVSVQDTGAGDIATDLAVQDTNPMEDIVSSDTAEAEVVCELANAPDGGIYCRMENVPVFRTCFLQQQCLEFDAGGGPCCELLA